MAYNIEEQTQRHASGWSGFAKFLLVSTVAVAVVLLLMAAFLL